MGGIDFNGIRHCGRKTLNVNFPRIVMQDTAVFHPNRLSPGQMYRHLYANGLIHQNFEQVCVKHFTCDGIDLIIPQKSNALRFVAGSIDAQRDQRGRSGMRS